MQTCSICLIEKTLVSLKPCSHEFCAECVKQIIKFNEKQKLICPYCRQTCLYINTLREDEDVVVPLGKHAHAGLTLNNYAYKKTRVKLLKKGDVGCKYLNKGDVITHINGIPAYNHAYAVDCINYCSFNDMEAYFKVEKKKDDLVFNI
jgi:hypothetical protein